MTVHHVALKNQNCPVTVIYPYKSYLWEVPEKATPITTDDLRPYREELHKRFCLARDLPYLRVPRHNKPGIVLRNIQLMDYLLSHVFFTMFPQSLPGYPAMPHCVLEHNYSTLTFTSDKQVRCSWSEHSSLKVHLYSHWWESGNSPGRLSLLPLHAGWL